MKIHELQNIVIVEAVCLSLIVLIIIATFKRWKTTLIASGVLATIAFFSAWSNIMALGSMLVFGSASTLLWWQIDKQGDVLLTRPRKYFHFLLWSVLATGVAILILNNTRNIFIYLG